MVTRKCDCCSNAFSARQADVNRGWARFCSKRCKAIKQTRDTGRGAPTARGLRLFTDLEVKHRVQIVMVDHLYQEDENE